MSDIRIYARGDLRGRVESYCATHGFDGAILTPNLVRSDAPLMHRPWWIYSTPSDGWFPSQFEQTIIEFERLALSHGAKGYYADTEWGRSVTWGASDIRRLANALLASKRRSNLDIIVTDFDADGVWKQLGPLCGSEIGLSLQMYSTRTLAGNQALIDSAKAHGWDDRFNISGSSYVHVVQPGPNTVRWRTPAEQSAYQSAFPTVESVSIWYPDKEGPGIPTALTNVIREWKTGLVLPLVGPVSLGTLLASLAILCLLALAVIVLYTAR